MAAESQCCRFVFSAHYGGIIQVSLVLGLVYSLTPQASKIQLI